LLRRVFSTDHKVIGLQYAFTSLAFLVFGFALDPHPLAARRPGRPLPLVGGFLGQTNAPGGVMLPEFYNQLGAMHGTIMVFLGVVPLGVDVLPPPCRLRDAGTDMVARRDAAHHRLLAARVGEHHHDRRPSTS
jgi:hypothetical protein